MAEHTFRKLLSALGRHDVTVTSAGTTAVEGVSPTEETIAVMKEEAGIDVSEHRSRPLTPELIEAADGIYVMTDAHKVWVTNLKQEAGKHVTLLQDEGVPDPIGQSRETYRQCFYQIRDGLTKILDEL